MSFLVTYPSIIGILFAILAFSMAFWFLYKITARAFLWGIILCVSVTFGYWYGYRSWYLVSSYFGIYILIPSLVVNLLLYVYFNIKVSNLSIKDIYMVHFKTDKRDFKIANIKRGASVIGSAGSGKTESVLYNFLQHFAKCNFCGVMHDYKDFELTEIAYPLFKKANIEFYPIALGDIDYSFKVNPIAPIYMKNEEDVNEISKVLLQNLLEKTDSHSSAGATKFFDDASEGIIGGLIWKLKTDYPQFCTLPHLILLFSNSSIEQLSDFLESNPISKVMADAFIKGKVSEKQTAAVLSTLSNGFKKITTRKIFMVLSDDEVSLNINNSENKAVVSIINNPKYDSAYSPLIATIMHTITKQMSLRGQEPSFLMMEEAPTIRLLNMHRIPATLRAYNVCTIYVMQDKIQNDMLYGDKASKAILSNLSYQFFGKVNDPDTAKYYERFFEIIKSKTKSVNTSYNLNFDTRVTTGEKEIAKIRAFEFFKLKQGEFITFSDGQEKKVQFALQNIVKQKPELIYHYSDEELQENYDRIVREVSSIFD